VILLLFIRNKEDMKKKIVDLDV